MELNNVMETEKKITILGKECTVRKMTFGDLVAYKKFLKEELYSLTFKVAKANGEQTREVIKTISGIKVTDEDVEEALSSMDGASFLISRIVTGLSPTELESIGIDEVGDIIQYAVPSEEGVAEKK